MNVAIIFAGGVGNRMRSRDIPKQFLVVNGKPVIIHTLEHFQNSQLIDLIVISCVDGWENYLRKLLSQYHIDKVGIIVPGGDTGQRSIYNGLVAAKELVGNKINDTIVLIHDGVRPLISAQIILDNIESVKTYRSAITCGRVSETVVCTDDNLSITGILERSKALVAKAPQSFYLNDILSAHMQAQREGIDNFIDSCSLMRYYGFPLKTIIESDSNIKITTQKDYYMMRAILQSQEDLQLYID